MAETKRKSVRTRIEKNEEGIILTLPPVKAPHWLQGFVDFVREQGVVGVATGLVLGVALKTIVDSLVANIFNPLIGLVTGGGSLASKAVCLNSDCTSKLRYGQVLSDVLSFIIIAAVVYMLIKILKLDKLDKKKT